MLLAARSAPDLLPEGLSGGAVQSRRTGLGASASEAVERFLTGHIQPDGGFRGRSGASDLYFTVFGLEAMLAVGADVPARGVARYLRGFGAGASLDLVHLACLARCWANLPDGLPHRPSRPAMAGLIEQFRSADGGYAQGRGSQRGTAYACFLSLGAYQDLQQEMPEPNGLARCVESLRTGDGGYANAPAAEVGSTPATAAAVTVLHQLGRPIRRAVGEWLMGRLHPAGGFLAVPAAPLPDLLSTATALHALAAMRVPLEPLRRQCLAFIASLRRDGGYCGSWADDVADCEYTYYALLALGHLSR